jgi:putative FmdB family regulatory protein
MPIYEYRCKKGHTFEIIQRMTDEPLIKCTVCGAPVQRVFHPVAVHFKGSGFYNTDYGKKKAPAAGSDSSKGSEKESSAASTSSKSDSKSDSSSSSSSSSKSSSD